MREREAKCVQENPPGCTAGCPVHVDVKGMVEAVRKGDYARGLTIFRKMVPFPGIICIICQQPCQQGCKRNEIDESIEIRALEKICVDNNQRVSQVLTSPSKNKQVAIVGAGLSGLTVAVELAPKGYGVVVFEKEDHLGGKIVKNSESGLSQQVIEADLAIFKSLSVKFNHQAVLDNRKGSVLSLMKLCEDFDAIYLGIGSDSDTALDLGLERDGHGDIVIDPVTLATSHPKVFAGGSLRRGCSSLSPIHSIADGKMGAISIDRLLQNASLTASRPQAGAVLTTLYTNIEGIEPQPKVAMVAPGCGYTTEEALQEANRCLLCECRECVKTCEYLDHYHSYPKRYVHDVYNNLAIVMGIHRANKLINSCSLCGLCAEVCPNNLNMGEVCHEARQLMVEKGKMPLSAHEFALQDMQFSNSDHFALVRHQPGFNSSETVFFPSCQLAASSPHYVAKIYQFLCEKISGGVALMLGCCGAPANWAGQKVLFKETIGKIEGNWRALGRPKVVTACPTCFSMFKNHLPELPVENLVTLFDQIAIPTNRRAAVSPKTLAIHDSCTTRHEVELQNSVRNILEKLGHTIEELPYSRDYTTCCGYGGLMIYANKEVAHKVINRRITESDTDYLAYCVMCRDNFASQGKRVYHLLDLIFGIDHEQLASREAPGYSERQTNRARLKTSLLQEFWGETVLESRSNIQVVISQNVKAVMEERMILVNDVTTVISYAESTGNKLQNKENSHYIAYFKPVNVTYWVEYSPQEEKFVVHNAYCHRLEITG